MQKTVYSLALVLICSFFLSSCVSVNDTTDFSDPLSPRYAKLDIAVLPQGHSSQKTIKIVSYNTELCARIKGAKVLLRKNKDLADADIICLQEMSLEAVKEVADFLQYNYVYYPCAIHPATHKDFGQAILSKWPIKDDKKVLLPFSSKDRYIKIQKSAVAATVMIGDKEIQVFSAQLGVIISPERRKAQTHAIIAAIDPTLKYTVICGDFNTYAQIHYKAIMQEMDESGFKSATKQAGWTYKYWYLFDHRSILDHIFYKGLKLTRSGKVINRFYSDHLPIWAEFEK